MTDTTASHATWERERRVSDNFTPIPHGLWTLDVSPGARCLLGWLHSHSDAYLSKLSQHRVRSEFGGSGQVAVWLDELVEAGFVRKVDAGQSYRFILVAAPWNKLACRKRPETGQHDEPSGNRTPTFRVPDSNLPDSGNIEEHVEDHVEDQLHMLTVPVSEKTPPADFDAFWGGYPRKVGKGKALVAWRRLKASERVAALEVLPRHVGLWERKQVAREFIPHPTSWLNARRWEDEIEDELEHPVQSSRSAPGMGVIRAVMQNRQGELG